LPNPRETPAAVASPALRAEPPALRADPHPGPRVAALHALYDLAWLCAGVVAAPWLWWRSRREPAFRALVRERAGWSPPPAKAQPGPTVLVHGVSVGEVKGAVPLVEALAARFAALEIAVSATTNTGTQVAHELFAGRRIARFPIDTRRAVRRFLACVAPDVVVLIDLELWPNLLRECNRAGIPVAVVNGRITARSLGRHRRFHRLMPQFSRLSLVCVQDEAYAARFRAVGLEPRRIVVTGSLKADRLPLGPVDPGAELRGLLGAPAGVPVIVAGSTHEPEETLVVDAWRRGAPHARLVVVPRHPERAPEIARALERAGAPAQRLTELRAGLAPDPTRPCIADTIGELERIYGLADVAFVGGSLMPHGGQNLLEPAAQGKAVVCGPHTANFAREAALLVERGACAQVADTGALAAVLAELAADPARRAAMGARGLEVVAAEKGATARTVQALEQLGLGR
jgi:3-deoxy-D-manno-octulosonic-acid transferase